MALNLFTTQPFSAATRVSNASFFVGDNSTTTFPVTNESIYDIGTTIQYSSTLKYYYAGGFTKDFDTNEITINSAPGLGQQGVIPGQTAIVLSAFDQANVSGIVGTANIEERRFYLGDTSQINLYGYRGRNSVTQGIAISFVDAITSSGVDLSFVQLCCTDGSGNTLTYGATGQTLYTPSIDQFGTVAASANSGSTTILCGTASSFIPGDFIYINFGNVTQEIVKYTSLSGSYTMNLATATNYGHGVGETIYACVREFGIKYTVPIDVTAGVAQNDYSLYLDVTATQYQRS